MLDLKLFENRVVLQGALAPGEALETVRVVTGSRMLVTLLVITADPGASVALDVANSFEEDFGYESIGGLAVTGVGRQKKIFSDFHNLFQFKVTVSGGNVTYKVGVSLADNAMTTRIENAQISVELTATEDSVKIGGRNGTDFMEVNPDGSINTRPVDDPGEQVVSRFAEEPSVAAEIQTEVISYTVPTGKRAWLQRVENSGENLAEWTILLNGDVIALKRAWQASSLNVDFEFSASPRRGFPLQAGDVITVEVVHSRLSPGKFESRIQVVELSI